MLLYIISESDEKCLAKTLQYLGEIEQGQDISRGVIIFWALVQCRSEIHR